jgi:AraC-like DNA-binding protein
MPIERINQFFVSNDPNKAFLIDLSSQELVYNLIKSQLIQDSFVPDLHDPISYAIQYLKAHNDHSICINEIAYVVNMSASNFSSRFKKQSGYTPKEYHNLLKIKKAKDLLKNKSVTDVCYTLGFENISYFIQLFKKYYGETLKQYLLHIYQ